MTTFAIKNNAFALNPFVKACFHHSLMHYHGLYPLKLCDTFRASNSPNERLYDRHKKPLKGRFHSFLSRHRLSVFKP